MDRSSEEAGRLIGVGAQGTAALFIATYLLRTLMVRKILPPIDVAALMELAAEKAETAPDATGGTYSRAVGANIRQVMEVLDLASPPQGPRH